MATQTSQTTSIPAGERQWMAREILRLRKEADRDERRALRNGDSLAHCATIYLNRVYANRMEAELAGAV